MTDEEAMLSTGSCYAYSYQMAAFRLRDAVIFITLTTMQLTRYT